MDCCSVCWQPTDNRLLPCRHAVCQRCFGRWNNHGRVTCPMCRAVVAQPGIVPERTTPCVHLRWTESGPLGIELYNNNDGPGVVVLRAEPEAKFGLRAGVVITHINCMEMHSHVSAMLVLEAARKERIPVTCNIIAPRERTCIERARVCFDVLYRGEAVRRTSRANVPARVLRRSPNGQS